MTHPVFLREKARQLRVSKKLTIDELSDRLLIPRTTIYYWVRDLPIPVTERGLAGRAAARRRGSRAMQRNYRLLRAAAYEEAARNFEDMATDPTFRDFVCLYIAEGYKRNRNTVSVCNSDLAVIKVADRWMRALARNPMRYSIQYHADQDPSALRRFWGGELDIEPMVIKLQRKSNSSQLASRTWRCQYGVLSVGSHDTLLRARLEAWMVCLRAAWT
ncbi:MAG: helix-turn-helix transcriptional regulator [Thermoleophilaceae bacterium]|nr:helix-turn-helix transcriptional regulator [Thermoleophilaceae bacterium]